VKRVFKNIPDGKCPVGKPRNRWLVDVDNYLKKMSVRGWRKIARDRDAWKFVLKAARIVHRPYKRWRTQAVKMGKWGTGFTPSIFRA
jgi:hypothetical protein